MGKHKYAEVIHAWADGAEVQMKWDGVDWQDSKDPAWYTEHEYRIKPAKKVVRWLWAFKRMRLNENWNVTTVYLSVDEALTCFDDLTQYKKLEWSRQEFDE